MEKNNANDAYRAARERLDRRLGDLNHAIREHDERQCRDRENRALVGNIAHLCELIDEAIEFLGGKKVTP